MCMFERCYSRWPCYFSSEFVSIELRFVLLGKSVLVCVAYGRTDVTTADDVAHLRNSRQQASVNLSALLLLLLHVQCYCYYLC